MRKRVQIALAVLLLAIGGMIAWQVLRLREPVYQGKTLNAWLQEYVAADNQFPVTEEKTATLRRAGDGIRRIGTNALPFLVQMVRAKDSTATKSNSFCRFCKLSRFLEILRVTAVLLVGFGF